MTPKKQAFLEVLKELTVGALGAIVFILAVKVLGIDIAVLAVLTLALGFMIYIQYRMRLSQIELKRNLDKIREDHKAEAK